VPRECGLGGATVLQKSSRPFGSPEVSELGVRKAQAALPLRKHVPALIANAISLVALSLLLFRLREPFTLYQYDGTFILSVVKNQAEWMPGLATFSMDFLKGIGGLAFPINTRFIPGFLIGLFGGTAHWLPVLSATWFACEFAIATLVIGRAIGISFSATVMAAWLALLGALPYVVPTPFIERLWGNPHLLSPVSFSMIALALFVAVGRGSRAQSLACGAGIFAILVYLAIAYPLLLPLYAPILVFFGVVCLVTAKSRPETYWKLATVAVIGALHVACFGVWLASFMLYSKLTYFFPDMYPSPIAWTWPSLLLEKPGLRPAGVVFYCIALLGGGVAAFGRATPLRPFAIGYLAFNGLLWLGTAVLVVAGVQWRGGLPGGYFDMMIYPLHALFAANLVYISLAHVADRFLQQRLAYVAGTAAIVLLPWGVLAFWTPLLQSQWRANLAFPWPPQRTPIVEFLERHIALQPGEPFRGRVVNLAGSRFAEAELPNAPMINQHLYDLLTAYQIGNDHREYGFWYYDIPTLEETSPSTSPFFHVLMSRLLNPKGAWFFREHEWASVLEPQMLGQLGVKYVLTEQPLPDGTSVVQMDVGASGKQYLYELPDPNISGRAATKVIVAPNAAEALARLRAPDHDFPSEAVLFEPLPEGTALVPVRNSRFTVGRGFVMVSADAPGRALLVLPLEFSRCLTFTWSNPGAPPPLALRANLDQTAILFTDHVEGRIALRYGPLANPACRLGDMQDAARDDLAGVPR
jgi:hypothetical protein